MCHFFPAAEKLIEVEERIIEKWEKERSDFYDCTLSSDYYLFSLHISTYIQKLHNLIFTIFITFNKLIWVRLNPRMLN